MNISKILLLAPLVLLTGCDRPGDETTSSDQWTWSTMKSPRTGRCYEVATRVLGAGNTTYSYSGMSEVPCEPVPPSNS